MVNRNQIKNVMKCAFELARIKEGQYANLSWEEAYTLLLKLDVKWNHANSKPGSHLEGRFGVRGRESPDSYN